MITMNSLANHSKSKVSLDARILRATRSNGDDATALEESPAGDIYLTL